MITVKTITINFMQILLNKLKHMLKQLGLQPNSNTIIFLCLSLSFLGIPYWLFDEAIVIIIAILTGLIGLIGVDIGYHKGRKAGKEKIVTKRLSSELIISLVILALAYLSYRIIKHIYMGIIFLLIIQYIS